jgi:hypothetical protein
VKFVKPGHDGGLGARNIPNKNPGAEAPLLQEHFPEAVQKR